LDVFNNVYNAFELKRNTTRNHNVIDILSNNNVGIYIINKDNSGIERTILDLADGLEKTMGSLKTEFLDKLETLNTDINTGFDKQINILTQADGSNKLDSIISVLSQGFITLNEGFSNLTTSSPLVADPQQNLDSNTEILPETKTTDNKIEVDVGMDNLLPEVTTSIGIDILAGQVATALSATAAEGGMIAALDPRILLMAFSLVALGNSSDEITAYVDSKANNNSSYNLPYRDPDIGIWDKVVGAFSKDAYKLGYPYSDGTILAGISNLDFLSSAAVYDITGIAGWWYNKEVQGKRETRPDISPDISFQEYKDAMDQYTRMVGGELLIEAFNEIDWEKILADVDSSEIKMASEVTKYEYEQPIAGFYKDLSSFGAYLGGQNNIQMDPDDLKTLNSPFLEKYKIVNNTLTPNITINFGDIYEAINKDKLAQEINDTLKEEIKLAPEGGYNE